MYRDFSERSRSELLSLVQQVENEKLCDFTDWVGDRWYDFESWIGQLNIKNYLNNVNEYHRKVIDKNNATQDTINRIFANVKTADGTYAVTFKAQRVTLQQWQRYIDELCGIVAPQKGKFSGAYMKSKLGAILEDLTKLEMALSSLQNRKLIDFDFTSFFLDNRNPTIDAIAVGWTSDWFQNFTSLFNVGDNVNEAAVRKSIESVIKESLTLKHEASDFYDDYTDALMPDEVSNAKKIVSLFVKTGKTYTETELAKILDIDVKDITESDYLNWLCQSDNQQFLNRISDDMKNSIGAYADAVETLEVSAELLTKVFNDYTEDAKYIEAIKQALIAGGYDNKTVNDVVDSMLWEYRNQYISAAHDGIEKLVKKGADEGFDKLLNLAGSEASLLVNVFLEGKDITSSIIGLSDKTDDVSTVYATQQYSYALVEKYEFYRERINSGTYTKNDVEQYKSYFTLAKAAKLQEYRAIKKITEDALNSTSAFFKSDEDKEYTRNFITQIDAEIQRLESMQP